MNCKRLFLSFWVCLPILLSAQSELLRIEEADKYGYINLNGDMVISPKYINASNFSEGLAAVRLTDKFGFIDRTGNWQIPPIYDYATSFKNGQASVWVGRREMLISQEGLISKKLRKRHINTAKNGCMILESSDKNYLDRKYGVVNQGGEIILDTIYSRISWEPNGYYILANVKPVDGEFVANCAIADEFGILKVSFGNYKQIKSLGEGWYHVTKKDAILGNLKRAPNSHGILNAVDGIFRPITDHRFLALGGGYSDGSISVILNETSNFGSRFHGYMDTTGQVFLADVNYRFSYPFVGGLAFISDNRDKKIYLINKKGTRLNDIGITGLITTKLGNLRGLNIPMGDYFINDRMMVSTDHGIAKLNRNGDIKIIKELKGMYAGYFVENRYLHVIPKKKESISNDRGVYDFKLEKLLPIHYKMIYPKLYGGKLFFVKENKRSAYVDTSGKVVWQQKAFKDIHLYDVDHMVRLRMHTKKAYKRNWIFRLFNWKPKLFLGFRRRTFTENNKKYHANNLYLMNYSKDTLVFDAIMEGRIPLKLQAKDSNGEWKTINHNAGSDVAFLNAKRILAPGYYWYYRIPKFKGQTKTKFRVVVPYTKKGEPDVPLQMITTFEGGINPAQFWQIGS